MADGLQDFFDENTDCILVKIVNAKGSTPRSDGTWMLVGTKKIFETIGGGQMENLAIKHARKMMEDHHIISKLDLPLGPDIGQCCGGFIELAFETLDQAKSHGLAEARRAQQDDFPAIYVFGAGHVGKALIEALALLPLHVSVIDSRADQLAQLPDNNDRLEHHNLAVPESMIANAKPNSAFVILTHDHAQDFLIAEAALKRPDAAYVGMIGSASKLQTFRRQFLENGNDSARLENFTCPIGVMGGRDKRPTVIAALVAAQLTNVFFH